MPDVFKEFILCNSTSILDVTAHDINTDATYIFPYDCMGYTSGFVYIENTLDQAITVQFKNTIGRANVLLLANASVRTVNFGFPIVVLSADNEQRTFGKASDTMPQLIYPIITAQALPATGSVKITMVLNSF